MPSACRRPSRQLTRFLSILGTPTEEHWPGVTSYPDFKASFPKWARNMDLPICSNLDDTGLDLLEMMLVYDPAGRISAKQACNHPYFEDYNRQQYHADGHH